MTLTVKNGLRVLQMEWKLAYAHHKDCCDKTYNTIHELEESVFTVLPASVPGYLELELMKAGQLEDLYFSTNILEAQKYEDTHVWYYTTVQIENMNQYMHFAGIDTFADIYVNGTLVKTTDNMFLAYDVKDGWQIGKNEVVVHIKPVMIETRKYTPPARSYAMRYNLPTLYARKAAHMFGWDIMPRIVSAGIWKEVTLCEQEDDVIKEVYFSTNWVKGTLASVNFYINTELAGSFATDYTIKVNGCCGESTFKATDKMWHNTLILAGYLEFYEFFDHSVLAGVPDFVAADMVDGDTYTVIPAAFGALNQGILNVSKVKTGTVTMSRLTYMNGKYVMQMVLGNGKTPPKWEECGWDQPAPQLSALEIILPSVERFADNVACQHYIITYGDNRAKIRNLCAILGIEVFEM